MMSLFKEFTEPLTLFLLLILNMSRFWVKLAESFVFVSVFRCSVLCKDSFTIVFELLLLEVLHELSLFNERYLFISISFVSLRVFFESFRLLRLEGNVL